jgi:cyclopropane-fatty-acyl-phospholipid synthase
VSVADLLRDVLGNDVPVAFRAYDGSSFGPTDARTTIVVRSPDALRRIVTAPDELGFGRAYVAGELDVDGDIFDVMTVANYIEELRLRPRQIAAAAKLVGWKGLKPLPPPPEEARLRGRRHSRERDAAAISHHYDVSNAFYEMVLGPSLTYSCAVWHADTTTLEEAQADKYELICRKLDLAPGMRLLDVGCGWGGMLLHAA